MLDVALVVVAVLVVAFAGYVVTRDSEAATPSGADPGPPSGPPPRTVALVIGDSFTAGTDQNAGPEWPTIVGRENGWLMFTDAVGGTGYLSSGEKRPTFADRLKETGRKYAPDVVIIAGGRNDAELPVGDVESAAEEFVQDVRGEFPDAGVILLSPFASGKPDADTKALTKALADVADAAGVPYVDVSQVLAKGDGVIGADKVHPTNLGHQAIAAALAPELAQLAS